MAAGRAFVTSGPILTLDVAGPGAASGMGMGEELAVSSGDVVKVTATARSLFTMHRLEIVQNGRIIHTVDATGDMKAIEAELEIPIEGSGWIAARVLGPPQHGAMDSYLFAHTNPVFTIADGAPIRSPEDAAFFVRWIDQTLGELRAMDRWDDPAHKEEVLATFEEGQEIVSGAGRRDGRRWARGEVSHQHSSAHNALPLYSGHERPDSFRCFLMNTTATATQTTIPATVNQESSGVLSGWLAGVMSQLPPPGSQHEQPPGNKTSIELLDALHRFFSSIARRCGLKESD